MLFLALNMRRIDVSQIENAQNDDEVAQTIIDKLGDTPGISYARIAQAARARRDLAIQLLEREPRAADQVRRHCHAKITRFLHPFMSVVTPAVSH